MTSAEEALLHLQNVLEVERRYQAGEFERLLGERSIKERISNGITWYPLRLISSGYAVGTTPFIIVEQTKPNEDKDKFQAGRPVRIYTNHADEEPVKGIIHWINKLQMKLYLNSRYIPDWLTSGKLVVDLLYDEQTFIEMKEVIQAVMAANDNTPAGRLRRYFYDDQYMPVQSAKTLQLQCFNEGLNDSQKAAVAQAIGAEDIACIHGPPGTGKTTTLIEIIEQLVHRKTKILVCAPSNAAVDWITALLYKKGLSVLRLGHLSRIDNDVINCSLDAQVNQNRASKEVKKLRIQAEEYRKLAGQYKRHFGPEERQQRRLLKKQAKDCVAWADELEDRIIEDIIDHSDVIVSTLSGNRYINDRRFDVCIIDEAAQALQPACWVAMLKADKVILAGDPFQLPPTVKSPEAMKGGLGRTLLDIAIEKSADMALLNVQYRMHSAIMDFSNRWFYNSRLVAHDSVSDHALAGSHSRTAVEFVDTAGCSFDETMHSETRSYFNNDEYTLLREHLNELVHEQYLHYPDIGIISPYKEQVYHIRQGFEEEPLLPEMPLSIHTIDGFQGQERDIIYISLVRSNAFGEIGFLKDYRRMNVAMTRARKKLIIIGDSATLANDPYYEALLDYIHEIEAYRSAWEFIQ